MKFVTYTDGDEVIITTKKLEERMLEECFSPDDINPHGTGDRELVAYYREESSDNSISFSTSLHRNW